jgi:hypothetical protein
MGFPATGEDTVAGVLRNHPVEASKEEPMNFLLLNMQIAFIIQFSVIVSGKNNFIM